MSTISVDCSNFSLREYTTRKCDNSPLKKLLSFIILRASQTYNAQGKATSETSQPLDITLPKRKATFLQDLPKGDWRVEERTTNELLLRAL